MDGDRGPGGMRPLLAARGLAGSRGGVRIFEGVDFALLPGETIVLRGPNGSGKTTLLRTCAGLQLPVAGHLEGEEACAYAGHLDGVKAVLSVAENLAFWAEVFGQRFTPQVLHDFALHGLRDRAAGTLSAGQSRRLGLARLALTGRAVWLMDEPTVSLDVASVAIFARAVGAHCAAGGAAVIASHIDLTLAGADPARVLDMTAVAATAGGDGPFAGWDGDPDRGRTVGAGP